ncbi:MAG: hypothetical protein K2M05_03780 [Paramuribaculum sp.]|nr:hypothetical protein [Paramuribaculum sp.]MDE6304651.1 hypothetical protein [Paramuribaculum sp.]
MERVLAREFEYLGKTYRMCVAQLDTLSGEVTVFRFENEIYATKFIDGKVRLSVAGIPGSYRWNITPL